MANENKPITELPPGTTFGSTDLLVYVDMSGTPTTKKITEVNAAMALGISGYSGFSGQSGTGPTGTSGFSGFSGVGATGGTGTSGFSGFSGVQPTVATFNNQIGTTYSLQSSDDGLIVTCDNGSPIDVTIPSGLGIGFNCMVIQLGAGQVSFLTSSTTLHNRSSHTKIAGQYGVVTLIAYTTNVFDLAGDTGT